MLSTLLITMEMFLANVMSIPLEYVLYPLGAVVVLLVLWVIRLELRLYRLAGGKNGKSLEHTIENIRRGQRELEAFRKEIERYLTDVERRLTRSVRDVKTIRFNPFKGAGMGGNQSFASALLSEDGDGVILSSLYARDHVSMFAKPVSNFKSEHELTEEEQQVLTEAKISLKKKHDHSNER